MKPNSVRINIKHGAGCRRYLVSGYKEKVSGQTISYHSHHPEASEALLARADQACNRISWKSGMLPNHSKGELTFVFLAAIAGSKGGKHKFTLFAEQDEILRFVTTAPEEVPFCQTFGQDGARMRFEHVWSDVFNDHFGLVYLTIQDRMSYSRTGVTFSIVGEDAGSDDWFMVFQYPLSQFPRVTSEPVLKDFEGKPAQILKITYDNIYGNCSLALESSLETISRNVLQPGANTFRLGIPAVEQDVEIKADFYLDDVLTKTVPIPVKPVRQRTVYVLPFSHNDIGYTDLQTNVIKKQCANIDLAIAEKLSTLSYPTEAQARWNLEVIWALEIWWEQASTAQKLEFV
jgi:alpha-mannosidase